MSPLVFWALMYFGILGPFFTGLYLIMSRVIGGRGSFRSNLPVCIVAGIASAGASYLLVAAVPYLAGWITV